MKRISKSLIVIGCILLLVYLTISPYRHSQDIELETWAHENNISLSYGSSMLSKSIGKQAFKQKILENKISEIEIGLNLGYTYVIEYRNPVSGFYERFCYYKKPGDVGIGDE